MKKAGISVLALVSISVFGIIALGIKEAVPAVKEWVSDGGTIISDATEQYISDALSSFSVSSLSEPNTTATIIPDNLDGNIYVHYIDVGQADCELIVAGEDTMLIDCGNADDSDIVLDYLAQQGISQIDYFIASHAHEDHIGCASAILESLDISQVYVSPASSSTVCYKKMMETILEKNIACEVPPLGTVGALGDGQFQIIGPIDTVNYSNLNNSSIVLKYTYGTTSFLFQGDAEREEEQAIIDAGYDVNATVYKVGHHGSDTSTSYPWLRAIMPQFAVIEVDAESTLGQQYGHPSDNTLSKLRDAGVERVYRTDKNGNIVATSDGHFVSFSCQSE